MDIRTSIGLRRVVNLCGVPSAFGAGSACAEAIDAASRLLPLAVDMLDLQRRAGSAIARATGAEAGCVTGCAAAGLTVAVAATLTGRDLAKVRDLPRGSGLRRHVLVQREHEDSCGAPLRQMVGISGARLRRVGRGGYCSETELAAALRPDVAAALYVCSVGAPRRERVGLERYVGVCHAVGVPVIVDGAAEMDFVRATKAGADLAIYSAQKILGGLTAGIIAGRRDLVAACLLQERGIGRPMKAGKEAVVAAIAALERWEGLDMPAMRREWERRLGLVETGLSGIRGLVLARDDDPYGRGFRRLKVVVEPASAGINAWQLAAALRSGDPAVVVWPYDVAEGVIFMDVRCATDDDLATACAAVHAVVDASPACAAVEAPPHVGHDAIDQEFLAWPDRLQ